MCDLCRRSFMHGTAALLGAGALPTPLLAQAQTSATDRIAPASLPERGDFVIRNGYVLTMEAALGDIPRGSVHVRNGTIVAVGADVNAPDAQVIDAADMIVLPGLIETHWHAPSVLGQNPDIVSHALVGELHHKYFESEFSAFTGVSPEWG